MSKMSMNLRKAFRQSWNNPRPLTPLEAVKTLWTRPIVRGLVLGLLGALEIVFAGLHYRVHDPLWIFDAAVAIACLLTIWFTYLTSPTE